MQGSRGNWSSRFGFVLAASGSAIGLGNLWKFPYITWDNRGGAFVLVYLVCIAVVGLPIMITEIMIGRRTQRNPIGAIKRIVGPAWGFVGALGMLTGFVILGYYGVIAGWSIHNLISCLNWSLHGFPPDLDVGADFAGNFLPDGGRQMLGTAIFAGVTMWVVSRGIGNGIERVARILMPILFVILLVLLATTLTMSGAGQALKFIFEPRFDQLGWEGVLEALGHSFFTLSLGMGAMITYGSYLSRNESVVRASVTVVVLDTLIALVATTIMFSVIFTEGMQDQINASPVGMLFVTLPRLFYTTVPMGALLAPLFYVLVGFAALTSTISMLEVLVSYFIDERRMSRPAATLMCGGGALLLGLGCALSLGASQTFSTFEVFSGKQGLLGNLDHLASNWMLPVGGLLITILAGWIMTSEVCREELIDETTPNWFNFKVWHFAVRFIAPAAVVAIILAVILLGKDFS